MHRRPSHHRHVRRDSILWPHQRHLCRARQPKQLHVNAKWKDRESIWAAVRKYQHKGFNLHKYFVFTQNDLMHQQTEFLHRMLAPNAVSVSCVDFARRLIPNKIVHPIAFDCPKISCYVFINLEFHFCVCVFWMFSLPFFDSNTFLRLVAANSTQNTTHPVYALRILSFNVSISLLFICHSANSQLLVFFAFLIACNALSYCHLYYY